VEGGDPFVVKSVLVRLPDILANLVSRNEQLPEEAKERIAQLEAELRAGEHKVIAVDDSDGGPDWTTFCTERLGQTSNETDWWFLENYVYRLVAQYVDYFNTDCDPFAPHKKDALDGALRTLKPVSEHGLETNDAFHQFVLNSLWGNQVDLSFSAGEHVEGAGPGQDLAVDEAMRCWDLVLSKLEEDSSPKFIIILDNCGAELLNDLILADFLLRTWPASTVTFHAKSYPVFVSDAIPADVDKHVQRLSESTAGSKVAQRLRSAAQNGRFTVDSSDFYTGPQSYWEAPRDLADAYKSATLVMTKGDANYRRLIGDRNWPLRTSFSELMSYWPCNLLAIRTCKSPAAVGFTPEQLAEAPTHTDWLVNGRTGLVQFRHHK